jgi:hypothetical protein
MALKIESSSGVAETTPGVYVVLGAESRPKNYKPTGQRQVYGTPDPILPWRKPENTDLSLPMLPLVEDNGLGELLMAHMGSDEIGSELGGVGAYAHVFTRAAPFKTLTVWVHDGIQDKKIRMMAPDTFSLTVKRDDGDVQPVFDLKGADMFDASDFGSASYVDLEAAQPKALNALQARLEWGQPGANIRDNWEQIKFTSALNTVFGVNGKDGMHIAGSGSPQLVTSSKIDTKVDIDFVDLSGEEMRRWYEGVDTNPSATQQHDNAGLIDYQFTLFGNIIGAAAPWGEADLNNIGTATITVAGTYSGGATSLTMYEVKLAQGTPDTYSYRYTTGGKWSAWSSVENIFDGGFLLGLDTGDPVQVTISYGALATGADIAAAIQAAIQALGGDYAAMTCVWDDTNYTISHATKLPVVTPATRNNLAVALKLGVANGGVEAGTTSVSAVGGATTLVAQPNELADGITMLFSSSTLGADLDRFYVYSHRLRFLRVISENNMIENVTDNGGADFKKGTISAYHTSGPGSTKPSITACNTKSTAYA